MTETTAPISPDLLEILRDPRAVQEPEKYGPDPGKLELVHGCWLVSNDTGYKYPIKDGIPVMLIEEGARWKDTAVADLPVPPPDSEPTDDNPLAAIDPTYETKSSNRFYLMLAAGVIFAIIGVAIFMRKRAGGSAETVTLEADAA